MRLLPNLKVWYKEVGQMTDMVSKVLDGNKLWFLSVGSGDGSQQASIVKQGHRNIVVTFYDSRDEVCLF